MLLQHQDNAWLGGALSNAALKDLQAMQQAYQYFYKLAEDSAYSLGCPLVFGSSL